MFDPHPSTVQVVLLSVLMVVFLVAAIGSVVEMLADIAASRR